MTGQVRAEGQYETTWTDAITPRPIEWIWPRRVALGKLTVVGGDPGVGKGTLGIDLVARHSTGNPFPDGHPAPIGRSLLLTGEDDPEDTIAPRLIVAGADRSRVGLVGRVLELDGEKRRVSLDSDADALLRHTAGVEADLLVIDPLSSYLGEDTNSWRDSDMRRILDPLAEAAGRYRVAVLLVVHLTKNGGSRALYRFQGSIASIGAARLGFLVAPLPNAPELLAMASAKSNVSRKATTLTFRIETVRVEELSEDYGRVQWVGSSPVSADELLEPQGKTSQARERAEAFLSEYLAAGPALSDDVKVAARGADVGKNVLWDAKTALAVEAYKDGLGRWYWRLFNRDASPSNRDASKRPDEAGTLREPSVHMEPLNRDFSVSSSSLMEAKNPKRPKDPDISGDERGVAVDRCPRCRRVDYLPLGGGRLRCACGHVYGGNSYQVVADEDELALALASLGDADFPTDLLELEAL